MINVLLKEYEMNKENSILLDVREKDEFNKGHIPNAINIPLSDFNIANIDKSKFIYVYCHSGKRSQLACDQLNSLGFKCLNIGGFIDYKKN